PPPGLPFPTPPGGAHGPILYDFSEVMQHIEQLLEAGEKGGHPDAEAALGMLLEMENPIRFHKTSHVPHSMPPDHVMRLLAVQYFVRKDPARVEKVVQTTKSLPLKRLIQSHLDGAKKRKGGA